MTMMQVGNVRVIVCQGRMHMRMRMWLDNRPVVLVLVVLVVNVQMLMK